MRGFKKNLNFEQARHFCSKQDVQKQWSLDTDIKPTLLSLFHILNLISHKQWSELSCAGTNLIWHGEDTFFS